MKTRYQFPLGKAAGSAFCNRVEEAAWLAGNINAGKHSLIVAPRRYGKSSLADKAILDTKIPSISINFNICADESDVERLIRKAVSQLIGKAIGSIEKAIDLIKRYAQHLTPKIVLGPEFAQLELTAGSNNSPASNIEAALNLLEKLLSAKKKQAILLFDEFQTVGQIAKGKGIEAAIRNSAQSTQRLSFIFSGSNRSLLQTMFEDSNRPLYKLCRKLYLQRMEEQHYRKHLNRLAKLAWKSLLTDDVFAKIMLLTGRHPYYVNYLCDVLWNENNQAPSTHRVSSAWNIVLQEEASNINAELANLSLVQRKVIRRIAQFGGEGLTSAQTLATLNMAQSSVASAIKGLLEKDFIEKAENGYMIINPALECILKEDCVSSTL